jgi:hypothetical protein
MANFTQLLIGAILILAFISLSNVNSSPVEAVPSANVQFVQIDEVTKKHQCLNDLECGHGKCANETASCICDRGYTTHGNITGKIGQCNYDRRSKLKAFLFSLLAGEFGVDWFYLSRSNLAYIFAGILKLSLGFVCCSAWPLTYFGPEIQNSETMKAKLRGVNTCFTLLAFAWWIVDWARILGNRFPDGNAADLIPW